MSNFRQWQQVSLDFQDLKTAYELTHRNLTWNYNSALNYPIYSDNPYWDAYENYESDQRNRFIGNASVDYKITDWLDVYGRISADSYYEVLEDMVKSGEIKLESGFSSMKKRGLSGDFKFVLIDRIMLNDFKLSSIESFIISLYSLVKRISIPEERAFNLDNTSIIVEKVPIIIDQPVGKRIGRI